MTQKIVIIAPDKFKGSLSAIEFCKIVSECLKEHLPEYATESLPMADGGDGTLEVINYYLGGKTRTITVKNPIGNDISASYLYSKTTQTAYIEMAEASGMKLLAHSELNPINTSTFGTGQLIADAIDCGAKKIILGIGGSATNDAGIGMAKALGYQFFDKNDQELSGKGKDLTKLYDISDKKVLPHLFDTEFLIACDVDNPLYGPKGAAYTYASQKGASEMDIEVLNQGLEVFNRVIQNKYKINLQEIKGSGAAGGLGAGSIVFLKGKLTSGINLIKELSGYNEKIKTADWLITGEGALDHQTLQGKVIMGLLGEVTSQKTAIFCGVNHLNNDELKGINISYADEIFTHALNKEDAMINAAQYLNQITLRFVACLNEKKS